jgi:hypothetical protein
VLEQFIDVFKLPPEIVTDESDDEILMSLINLSFIQLMNFYLEKQKCPVSPANITIQ